MAEQRGREIKAKVITAASKGAETSAHSSAEETFHADLQTPAPTSSGHHAQELIQMYEELIQKYEEEKTKAEQQRRKIKVKLSIAASEAAETSANSSAEETFHDLQIPAPTLSGHLSHQELIQKCEELIQKYEEEFTMEEQQRRKMKMKLSTAASEAAENSANSSAVETFHDLQTSPTSSEHHAEELIQKYEKEITSLKRSNHCLQKQYDDDIGLLKIEFKKLAAQLVENNCKIAPLEFENNKLQKLYQECDHALQKKTQEWKDAYNELYTYKKQNFALTHQNEKQEKQLQNLKSENESLTLVIENTKENDNLKLRQIQNLEMQLNEQINRFENLDLLNDALIDQLLETNQREEESVKKERENERLIQNQDSEIAALKKQLSKVTSQLAILEKDINQKKQEIQNREDGLMAREQALLSAETSCNLKLSQCEEVLNNMEQVQIRIKTVIRMHAENKELRIQEAKKRGGLASLSQVDISLLRERRVGDLCTKYNQELNSLHKQLVDAHVKIAKLGGQTLNKATVKKTLHQPTAATTSRNVSSTQTRFGNGNKENCYFQTPLYKK